MDALPPLKCNGCRLCCLGDVIPLRVGDNPDLYKTKKVGGVTVLAHGKDGNCIYLGPKGCRKHGQAPLTCREFDCRKLAAAVMLKPPEQVHQHLKDPRRAAAIREGARRLMLHRNGVVV